MRRFLLTALLFASAATAHAGPASSVFATAPSGASSPDSVLLAAGSLWVAYPGGTTSDGTEPTGNSTVVRYSLSGATQATFSFKGYTDGLDYNPATSTVWALQNQDGNSSVNLIAPATNAVTTRTYAQTSPSQGYDEIAFTKNGAFLSYTNPSVASDPVLRRLVPGTSPIQVTDVATLGDLGLTAFDADSLKVAPDGTTLLHSGGDQGTLVFYQMPGTSGQSITVVPLTQGGQSVSGLDDTAFVTAARGVLFASVSGQNDVLRFDLSGLPTGTLLASIGSLQEIAIVDPTTGALTPYLTGLPGIHGLVYAPFAAVPEPGALALLGVGALGLSRLRRR